MIVLYHIFCLKKHHLCTVFVSEKHQKSVRRHKKRTFRKIITEGPEFNVYPGILLFLMMFLPADQDDASELHHIGFSALQLSGQ